MASDFSLNASVLYYIYPFKAQNAISLVAVFFPSILRILRLGVRMWLKRAAQTCKFQVPKED